MSSQESFDVYDIYDFVILAVVGLMIIKYLIGKLRKKNELPSNSKHTEDEISSANVLQQKFHKEPRFLQRVAEKISEERQQLMKSFFEEHPNIQKYTLDQLLSKQSASQRKLYKVFQGEISEPDERVETILENLTAIMNDFSTLRNQLKEVNHSLSDSVRKSIKKLPSSNEVTVPTQTEDLVYFLVQPEMILGSEIMNCTIVAAKECFVEFATEIRNEDRKIIQSISKFAEQSQMDIQEEITIVLSTRSNNDKNERRKTISEVDAVERVRKKLSGAFIVLSQQRFEMENLNKTLRYYNDKFFRTEAMLHTDWQMSSITYGNALQRLKETEDHYGSVAKKVCEHFRSIFKQSKSLWNLLSDMRNVLEYYKNLSDIPQSLENLEEKINVLSNNTEIPWAVSLIDFSQKLEELLAVANSFNGKLQSVSQSSMKLGDLHDLVKNIADGYGCLLNFSQSLLKDSRTSGNTTQKRKEDPAHFAEQRENNDSNLGMLNDHDKIMQTNNCGDIRFEMKNISVLETDTLGKEVYHEIGTESHNINLSEITVILKDIAQATRELAGCYRLMPEVRSVKHDSAQISNLEENNQVTDDWQEIPSETLLAEIESGYLIQNSEDSD